MSSYLTYNKIRLYPMKLIYIVCSLKYSRFSYKKLMNNQPSLLFKVMFSLKCLYFSEKSF